MPFPQKVTDLLIWHRGALGDLLLAGPALMAIRHRYPRARITGVGHPERWGLLSRTLALTNVWDGETAVWADLYAAGPLGENLISLLSPFQAALIFTPQPPAHLMERLRQAGVAAVHWVPSFSPQCREHPSTLQVRRLAELGIPMASKPFRLILDSGGVEDNIPLPGGGPWAAVAPGSGHPCKNWPLSHYFQVTRALAWQRGLSIIWLTGPAEEAMFPYVQAMAQAQGHLLLNRRPLLQVAQTLARCAIYLGGDSGLTHLAAAAGAPKVLALFGPTDPRIWAPRGKNVSILQAPCLDAPCARGREIPCPEPRCFDDLSPETVLVAVTEWGLGKNFWPASPWDQNF
ncbi:MAG: glycosyltransferase family 9 protein [Deltaproteobacteria bacterium]|nr:glycosyltransferase family 9 protein [Deltaproteobacteria bacterium]